MNKRLIAGFFAALAIAALTITPAFAQRPAAGQDLIAAGSSFDAPLFGVAFPAFASKHPHIVHSVNYQPLGSGTGQQDLNAKSVDFGCFDVPMLKSDGFSNFKKIVQFPVALGGVSIIYNLSGFHKKLRLSGGVLASIFAGKIRKWNAKAIKRLNHGVKLPKRKITPVVRADSSGTSYIFTDFLTHTSASWKNKYGASKSPAWPSTDTGAQHSSGVAGVVAQTDGSIGYVETSYYKSNKTQFSEAWVRSRDNTWLRPNLKTIKSDASHIRGVSPTHFSIVYSAGNNSYPISGFSWCGLYKHQSSKAKGKASVALFKWLVTKGEEKYGPPLVYAKIPKPVRKFAKKQLNKVKV